MKEIDLPLYKFYLIEGMTQEDLNELALERNNLSEEVYRLNNIINKAIDFLKENARIDEDDEYFCDDLRYDDCKKLLDILKGSDNE